MGYLIVHQQFKRFALNNLRVITPVKCKSELPTWG